MLCASTPSKGSSNGSKIAYQRCIDDFSRVSKNEYGNQELLHIEMILKVRQFKAQHRCLASHVYYGILQPSRPTLHYRIQRRHSPSSWFPSSPSALSQLELKRAVKCAVPTTAGGAASIFPIFQFGDFGVVSSCVGAGLIPHFPDGMWREHRSILWAAVTIHNYSSFSFSQKRQWTDARGESTYEKLERATQFATECSCAVERGAGGLN